MSIKKVLITFLAFNFIFANSMSQNTFAMKRCRCYTEDSDMVEDSQSKESTEKTNMGEVPRKRVCANDAHQSKDEDDLALAQVQKKFEGLTRKEIKDKLLSGYKELGARCDQFIDTCRMKALVDAFANLEIKSLPHNRRYRSRH